MSGLTALTVRNAKPGRHADGRRLYLVVRDSGSRAWVLRTQVNGVRRDLGLGSATKLSLSDARAKAAEFRARLISGEESGPGKIIASSATNSRRTRLATGQTRNPLLTARGTRLPALQDIVRLPASDILHTYGRSRRLKYFPIPYTDSSAVCN